MKKILIVDDDKDILVLMQTMLSLHQYEVSAISNWEHIDNSISGFAPDLILLDISLGDADGRDICKRLKQEAPTENIPVILFSANTELGKNYEEAYAKAFIPKPFELNVLLKTIGDYVN